MFLLGRQTVAVKALQAPLKDPRAGVPVPLTPKQKRDGLGCDFSFFTDAARRGDWCMTRPRARYIAYLCAPHDSIDSGNAARRS